MNIKLRHIIKILKKMLIIKAVREKWRLIQKNTMEQNKNDSRFPARNNASKKTVEWHLQRTERKTVNLEFIFHENIFQKSK